VSSTSVQDARAAFAVAVSQAHLQATEYLLDLWQSQTLAREAEVQRLQAEELVLQADAALDRHKAVSDVVQQYVADQGSPPPLVYGASPNAIRPLVAGEYAGIASSIMAGRSRQESALGASSAAEQSEIRSAIALGQRQGLQLLDAIVDAEQGFDAARAQLAVLTAAPGSPPTHAADLGGLSILGPEMLSANEIAGWYSSLHGHDTTGQSPEALAQIYLDEGAAEGVRGDVAFAQAMVESAGFSVTDGADNFAGIGACDSCAHGISYPSVRMGIRAQIELLKAYADPHYTQATTARPAAYQGIDTLSVRGSEPTWDSLSSVWSSGPDYGQHVLAVYQSMVTWALAHPRA
jgi:hypothetical protein